MELCGIELVTKQLWSKRKIPEGLKCEIGFILKFSNSDHKLEQRDIEGALYSALFSLHGIVGVAQDYELKSYNIEDQTGILLTSVKSLPKLWTAMTLKQNIADIKCAFTINTLRLVKEVV